MKPIEVDHKELDRAIRAQTLYSIMEVSEMLYSSKSLDEIGRVLRDAGNVCIQTQRIIEEMEMKE